MYKSILFVYILTKLFISSIPKAKYPYFTIHVVYVSKNSSRVIFGQSVLSNQNNTVFKSLRFVRPHYNGAFSKVSVFTKLPFQRSFRKFPFSVKTDTFKSRLGVYVWTEA